MGYDGDGNLASRHTGDNVDTTFSNYHRGVAGGVNYPDGGSITRQVDDFGNVTAEIDQESFRTDYGYDDQNRITSISPPLGDSTSISWTANSMTVTRGRYKRTVTLDGFGNAVREVHTATGMPTITVDRDFDYAGRLTGTTMSGGTAPDYASSRSYDDFGKIESITTPAGTTYVSWSGDTQTITDPRGNSTTKGLRSWGEPWSGDTIRINKPETDQIFITRDPGGLVKSVSQGAQQRSYDYYNFHRVKTVSDAESGITEYTYDDSGNVLSTDNYRATTGQRVTVNEYDDLNRLVRVDYSWVPMLTTYSSGFINQKEIRMTDFYGYDLRGNLTQTERLRNETTYIDGVEQWNRDLPVIRDYVYDENGRLTSEKLSVDYHSFEIGYGYNTEDQKTSITYPSGHEILLAPNGLGLPTTIGNYVNNIQYHPNGSPKAMTYANGDLYQAAINGRWLLGGMTVTNGTSLLDYGYGYDSVGNITAINDLLDPTKSVSMGYDTANRLTSADGSWGQAGWTYDGLGNIQTRTWNGTGSTYSYNANNQLSSISGGITRSYVYDEAGAVRNSNDLILRRNQNNRVVAFYVEEAPNTVPSAMTQLRHDVGGTRVHVSYRDTRDEYFVYDQTGSLVYKLDEANGFYKEFYRLGNKTVASRKVELECADDFDGDGIPHCQEQSWMLNPYDPGDAGGDSDGDGLTNLQEFQSGTDATRPDTDGDGMDDQYELSYSGLGPTVPDADGDLDGDGFSNGQEYADGTDPTVPDPPKQVVGVQAVPGDGLVALSWAGSTQAGSYRVYHANTPFESVGSVAYTDVTGLSMTDSSLINGSARYYRVAAINSVGESVPSAQVSATPKTAAWWEVNDANLIGMDRQQNVYNVNGGEHIALTIFPSDGAAPEEYVLIDSGATGVTVLDAAVGPAGDVVVLWQRDGSNTNIKGAWFDPVQKIWSGRRDIDSSGTITHADVAINSSGMAVFAYNRYASVSRPDGSSGAAYVPMAAVVDPSSYYWYASRIDGNTVHYQSTMEVDVDINESGQAVVAWDASSYDETATYGTIDKSWVASWENGVWQSPVAVIEATDACCSDDFWNDTDPRIDLMENGDALVVHRKDIIAFAARVNGVWTTPERTQARIRMGEDGAIVRAYEGRHNVVVERASISNGQVVWSAAFDLPRGSTLKGLMAAGQNAPARVFWRDENSNAYQSEWDGGAWVAQSTASYPSRLDAHTERSVDAAGNFSYVGGDGRMYAYGVKIAANYLPMVVATEQDGKASVGETGYVSAIGYGSRDIDLGDGTLTWQWSEVGSSIANIFEPESLATSVRFNDIAADQPVTLRLTTVDPDGATASGEFTVTVIDTGDGPVVDAGADQTVEEQQVVSLSGTVSDPDGDLQSYSWQQVSGPAVTLSDSTSLTPTFTSPYVGQAESLVFELTAEDQTGRQSSDQVTVTVNNTDGAPVPDETPPTVTHSLSSYTSKGKSYHEVTLTADESATIYVSLGGDLTWDSGASLTPSTEYPGDYIYNGPFTVQVGKNSSGYVQYWGKDDAGNVSGIESTGTLQ